MKAADAFEKWFHATTDEGQDFPGSGADHWKAAMPSRRGSTHDIEYRRRQDQKRARWEVRDWYAQLSGHDKAFLEDMPRWLR
jgi:hypothetical protein